MTITKERRQEVIAEYRNGEGDTGSPEVQIALLSEVAALCIDGIKNDNFWATYPSERQEGQLRARVESQVAQTPPDYLLNVTLMAPPPKKA